jgi:PAS domain S-box-containing protein
VLREALREARRVAERRRADQARVRSETRLQAILDHSAAVIFLKDVQGRYALVNRQFEGLFGDNVLGRTDYDIFPPEKAGQYRTNDQAVMDAGKPLTFEEDALQPDGVHFYVALKFPLRDPDGAMRFKAWRGLSPAYRAAVEGLTCWPRPSLESQPVVFTDLRADNLESLSRGRNKLPATHTKKVVIPGVNHLLVPATTGSVSEYSSLSALTVAPEVSSTLTDWLATALPPVK